MTTATLKRAPRPPAVMTVMALVGLGGFSVILLLLFLRAMPAAVRLAQAGEEKQRLLPCESLRPASASAKLGRFPIKAPAISALDYQGKPVSLDSLRGNVVLVNLWATWCPPCVTEMPSLEKLTVAMRGKPVRLLAVSVDEDWPTVRQFFAKGTPLEVLLDTERKVAEAFGTSKFPETFIVDKEGMLRYAVISDRDWSTPQVAECLERLADE